MTDKEKKAAEKEKAAMEQAQHNIDVMNQANEAAEKLEKVNEATDRLEKANEQMAANLTRQEQILAEKRLGGTTTAGETKLTEEEKAVEAAKKLVEGTGLNPFAQSGGEPSEK